VILRVWWIPQVPMSDPFVVKVESPEEGARVIEMLAMYDMYQYENRIKPDYSNAGGLVYFDEVADEWLDWYSEDGEELDEYIERLTEEGKFVQTVACPARMFEKATLKSQADDERR
jgi:hypothetical protein